MYEDIVTLIEEKSVSFPKFDSGSGVSEAAIRRAEGALKVPLPESYKWWLSKYGGGQIAGDIVYGIDEGNMGAPDLVELAQMNERDGREGIRHLVFAIGDGEQFYFATSERGAEGEYKVYLLDAGQGDPMPYANSFADFLRKRIKEMYRA